MDERRIRILYLIDGLGPGGTERRLVQLLKGLDREVFSPKLILLTDIVHYEEVYDLDLEVIKLDRKIRFDPLIFFRLHKICRNWRPDIIHAWGSMPATYAGPVAKVLRIKMINARDFFMLCITYYVSRFTHHGVRITFIKPGSLSFRR